MELSKEQKRHFYQEGFIKLPGIVPSELINAALWQINYSLGLRGMHPDDLVKFQNQSYCPELVNHPSLLDLVHRSPLGSLTEGLVGEGKVAPISKAQIALRFPNTQSPEGNHEPHLDGLHTPYNGVPAGTILSFTGLIGVFLSSLPDEYMGNFTVWPGSHHQYEAYFRQRGPQALSEGMPQVEALPEPVQIKAEPGDAVLCHYQLGHTAVANSSPHIRSAVFFRFAQQSHATRRWKCLTDIWKEWDGMQEVVEKRH